MARNLGQLAVSLALLPVAGCDESTTLVLEPNPAVRILIDASRCSVIPRCRSCVLETDAFDRDHARMAAAGRTNREVAQALFVTPKAIEYHLANAYRKLGIRGRPELARALETAEVVSV